MKFLTLSLCSLSLAFAATPLPPREKLTISPDTQRAMNLQTQTISPQIWNSSLFVIGTLTEIPERHAVLSSRAAGRVTKIFTKLGSFVKQGDLLVELESRQIGNPPPRIELRAPRDGTVMEIHVHEGEPVEPDREILDLCDLRQLHFTAAIPQHLTPSINLGTVAWVQIPGISQAQRATFTRWSTKGNPDSASTNGAFQLENPQSTLLPGTLAEANITLSSQPNSLAVPTAAIQGDAWQPVVFVKNQQQEIFRVPVKIGTEQQNQTQILAGLTTNEQVITHGAEFLTNLNASPKSLREQLDAAHGHAHNPDGSEISHEEESHEHGNHEDQDEHESHTQHSKHPATAIWQTPPFLIPSALALLFAGLWLHARRRH